LQVVGELSKELGSNSDMALLPESLANDIYTLINKLTQLQTENTFTTEQPATLLEQGRPNNLAMLASKGTF